MVNTIMPLTQLETEFIEAYIDEYMAIEKGPASRKLRDRGLLGAEVVHLLDAYSRAHPPRVEQRDVGGRMQEMLMFGRPSPNPPDPPWHDAQTARRRDAEVRAEREGQT